MLSKTAEICKSALENQTSTCAYWIYIFENGLIYSKEYIELKYGINLYFQDLDNVTECREYKLNACFKLRTEK